MRRRDVLVTLPMAGVAGMVSTIVPSMSGCGEEESESDPFGDRLPPHLLPSQVGILPEADKRPFWDLSRAIARRFELDELQRRDLYAVLDLKTRQEPSYLAEYRSALLFIGRVRSDQWDELFGLVLENELPARADWWSPSDHFRRFVFEELLSLHLIRGGCLRAGVTNFRGYMTPTFEYRTARGGR